jgi:hypothetical protein
MRTAITTMLAIAIMATISLSFKTGDKTKRKLQTLAGTYADAATYNYGKAWGNRVFTFSKGKWTLIFTLALDPEMKMQVFQFRTYGSYQVQEKSQTVADAYNALFLETKKFVTLKTDDENLIKAFGFAPCNLTKDLEQDISVTGCSAWKSVAECPGDHDLLALDKEGKLYFGNRPADNNMCSPEKRPTSLTPPVIKK